MSNETVTYSLEAVLTRIEGKIDNLQRDVTQISNDTIGYLRGWSWMLEALCLSEI